MIGNISRARRAAGKSSYPVHYLAGHYGFSCKILGILGERLVVVLLHDDGTSSHYRQLCDAIQLHDTRAAAQLAYAEGREDRKAAREARRAARAEYRDSMRAMRAAVAEELAADNELLRRMRAIA
jgi:hypothetical protein